MFSLPLRLHEGIEVVNWMVGIVLFSTSDEVGQEAVIGSAQRVVVARTWIPYGDAATRQCLEKNARSFLLFEHGVTYPHLQSGPRRG